MKENMKLFNILLCIVMLHVFVRLTDTTLCHINFCRTSVFKCEDGKTCEQTKNCRYICVDNNNTRNANVTQDPDNFESNASSAASLSAKTILALKEPVCPVNCNHGLCKRLTIANISNSFVCECFGNYTGPRCDRFCDLDCGPNAHCDFDQNGDMACTCMRGYHGPNCLYVVTPMCK